MVVATAAEEGVATGAEAMATLVATPLGGNSVRQNCVCLDPFPSSLDTKSNISSIFFCLHQNERKRRKVSNMAQYLGFCEPFTFDYVLISHDPSLYQFLHPHK